MRPQTPGLIAALAASVVITPPTAPQSIAATRGPVFETRLDAVTALAFAPTAPLLAAAGPGGVEIWHLGLGRRLRTLPVPHASAVAFSAGGRYLAVGHRGLTLWSATTGRRLRTLDLATPDDGWLVCAVVFNARGSVVVASAVPMAPRQAVDLLHPAERAPFVAAWSPRTGQRQMSFSPPPAGVCGLSYALNERALIGAGRNDLAVWDARTGAALGLLRRRAAVRAMAASPRGQVIASGHEDGSAVLWASQRADVSPSDLSPTRVIRERRERGRITAVAFTSDGLWVVSADTHGGIYLHHVSNEADRLMLDAGRPAVALATSVTGGWLAAATGRQLLIWRLEQKGGQITPAPPPVAPAQLAADIVLIEPSGEGWLDAGETGALRIAVSNDGPGTAYSLRVTATPTGTAGLEIGEGPVIASLAAGEERIVELTIGAGAHVQTHDASVLVRALEANGFHLDPPLEVLVPVRAFEPPDLVVSDLGIRDQSGDGVIEPREIADLTVRIENVGRVAARDVLAQVRTGDQVFLTPESTRRFDLGTVTPGESQDFSFTLFTSSGAATASVTIEVEATNGRYRTALPLTLPFRRSESDEPPVMLAAPPRPRTPPPLSSDVDRDIPRAAVPNANGVAVILGGRNYRNAAISPVDYAHRDAQTVRRYVIEALGFPEQAVLLVADPSKAAFDRLFGTAEEWRGQLYHSVVADKSDVFIFYSGHGALGPMGAGQYFVPSDADLDYIELTGYPVDRFYQHLAQLPSRSLTVVLETSFGGRPAAGPGAWDEPTVVLSIENPILTMEDAALFTVEGGSATTGMYREKRHGLLTYFFLKGLQGHADADDNAVVTLGEMNAYLTTTVPEHARRLHGREQMPRATLRKPDRPLVRLPR